MHEFNDFFTNRISIINYSSLVNNQRENCLKLANLFLFSFQNELQNYKIYF